MLLGAASHRVATSSGRAGAASPLLRQYHGVHRPVPSGLTSCPGISNPGSSRPNLPRPCAAAGGGDGGSGGGVGGGSGGSGGSSGGSGGAHPLRNATFGFALLLALGGGYAFYKKGSAKSLGAGLGASFILALCARSMVGATALGSARVAFAICTLLGIAMASRFNNTRKFMPAGLVASVSLGLGVGFLVVGL